jgi:hypothetical protein
MVVMMLLMCRVLREQERQQCPSLSATTGQIQAIVARAGMAEYPASGLVYNIFTKVTRKSFRIE